MLTRSITAGMCFLDGWTWHIIQLKQYIRVEDDGLDLFSFLFLFFILELKVRVSVISHVTVT